MPRHVLIQDRFFSQANALRAVFAEKFADPRAARSDRFVWDYWHVPNQYTLVRTPAQYFFPQPIFQSFLKQLGTWSQETLGCSAITPPWLSYYVEGCKQELHSDVPHGPWAFVYSLTPKIQFSGGETLLFRPEVLQYWRNFHDADDREQDSFIQKIPPRFNRLIVFDPRIPHGVTEVRGVADPREGRLVLHGWFTDPKPYLKGGLRANQVAPRVDEAVGKMHEAIRAMGVWHGVMSLRLRVTPQGNLANVRSIVDTLVAVDANPADNAKLRRAILKEFRGLAFPKAKSATEITLPLLFR